MSIAATQEAANFSGPLRFIQDVQIAADGATPEAAESLLQPAPEQEMLASIARTAYMGEVDRIPLIDLDALREGNDRVQQKFGDQARRLLIVGPDAIKFPDKATEIIRGRRVAELLGLLVLERNLALSSHYVELGFFPNSVSKNNRAEIMLLARHRLAAITDTAHEPLIRQNGSGTGFRSGIEDVLVSDIRHQKMYKTARHMHSLKLFKAYVFEGGQQPAVLESSEVGAARFILRSCEVEKLNDEQTTRFRQLSHRAASQLDQGSKKFHLVEEPEPQTSRQVVRSWFADEFSPEWHDRAACKGPDMVSIFYTKGERYEHKEDIEEREKPAKAICRGCAVQRDCLEAALAGEEKEGIWGGMNEKELKAYRRMLVFQQKAKAAE